MIANSRQSGMALLLVMLMIVLMIVLASSLTGRLRLDIARTSNQQQAAANWQRLLSGESLALALLKAQFKEQARLNLAQNWARRGSHYSLAGGELSGQIIDQRSCFNLNALSQPDNRQGSSLVAQLFANLLMANGVSADAAASLTAATRDWLDSDSNPRARGGEDGAYRERAGGYRPADGLMASKSQWREVAGVSAKLYQQMAPLLCALPSTALRVDLNTLRPAQASLLQALFFGRISAAQAAAIIARRPLRGYSSVLAVMANPELKNVTLVEGVKQVMSLTSRYFLLQLRSRSTDGYSSALQSLVERRKVAQLVVVRRTLGDWQ